MTFTIYALPATFAFLAKIGILLYDRRSNIHGPQTRLLLLFLLGFAVQNVIEISFFTRTGEEALRAPDDYIGRMWFSAAIFIIVFLLHFALITATGSQNTSNKLLGNRFVILLYAPAVVLQTLLWGGSLLIVSFEPMAYTFTKVAGPLYVLWEAYAVGYCAAGVGLLLHGARNQSSPRRRLQNELLLLGFVPLVVLALTIIGLQRVGFRGFNATATLPFTSTFLLIVAAYAIHHYRLLDIRFYIPWSNARKRKTELYQRIQALSVDIRKLDSPWEILERLAHTLRCQVTLLGGPQPWTAAPADHAASANRLPAGFSGEALAKIDRTVTIDEVADSDPELHALMRRYQVGAIVPFRSHTTISGYCLLLGERFNEEIYSSLDFKVVDRLFSAMARRFFEDFLLVRSQLDHVKGQLHDATRNLVRAEQNLTGVNLKLRAAKRQNRTLREQVARLRRASFRVVQPDATPKRARGPHTLDQYLAEREKEALLSALERSRGNKVVAARTLDIPLHTLNRLIARYGLDTDDFSGE